MSKSENAVALGFVLVWIVWFLLWMALVVGGVVYLWTHL